MSEFNFDEDWKPERTRQRIDEMQEEIDSVSLRMSQIDKELRRMEHRKKKLKIGKDKLAQKMSHNMRYRNALIDDLYEKNATNNPKPPTP